VHLPLSLRTRDAELPPGDVAFDVLQAGSWRPVAHFEGEGALVQAEHALAMCLGRGAGPLDSVALWPRNGGGAAPPDRRQDLRPGALREDDLSPPSQL